MGVISRFENPVVGIIGGTGLMGSWFADISEQAGARVLKVGRKTEVTPEDVAKDCNVVVVSVPVSVTLKMIKRIGPLISKDALFMDLTSIKKMPMEAMLRYSEAEVVGLHPLFGMDIEPEAEKKVVLCHGRGEEGRKWVIDLLENAGFDVIFLDPEEHDRLMGIVQGINHFETISLAWRIMNSGMKWSEIEDASTHTFMRKLDRIKRMFAQDPELFGSLMMDNDWSIEYIGSYLQDANRLFSVIKEKDKKGFKKIFLSIEEFLKREGGEDEGDMGKSRSLE